MHESSYTIEVETTTIEGDAFEIKMIKHTYYDGHQQFTWSATLNAAYGFYDPDGVEDITKYGSANNIEDARRDAVQSIKGICHYLQTTIDSVMSEMKDIKPHGLG